MKKLIAFLLAIVLCVTFAACGKKEDSEEVKVAKQLDITLASMTEEIKITDLYQVQALRKQYDALPEEAQRYVEHYSVLTDAEKTLMDIYLAEFNRLASLVETAASSSDMKKMDLVTARRSLTEANVVMEELECFDFSLPEMDLSALKDQIKANSDLILGEVCYPDTGIARLEIVCPVQGEDPAEIHEKGDRYEYIYMWSLDNYKKGLSAYKSYLDKHFTFVEEAKDNLDTVLNYKDDGGNIISLYYHEFVVPSMNVSSGFLSVYYDRVISDQKLHDYHGTNPLADVPQVQSIQSINSSNDNNSNTMLSERPEIESTSNNPTAYSIDLTTEKGNLKYVGFEKANDNLIVYGNQGNEEKNAIVLKFEFTNLQDTPSAVHSTFEIQLYQNGVEIREASAYSSDGGDQFNLARNYQSTVLKGSTVTFGMIFPVENDSKLSVMIKDKYSDQYQMIDIR